MHIICENVHSQKNTMLSCPEFVKKTSILSKTLCSHVIYLMKDPLVPCSYLVQKNVNSAKTRLYFGPKKSKGCLFFRFFTKNKLFSCPYIAKNNVHSLKHDAFTLIFFKNTSTTSKTLCSHAIFFNFFMKIPHLSCPYLFQKT